MKNRLKIHTVLGFAVVAFLLAQLGCSSKTSENAAVTTPSPSPSVDPALASASPTPEATPAVENAPAAVASSSGSKPRAVASNPEPNPSYAPPPRTAAPAPAAPEYNPPPPRVFTIREGTAITISTAQTLSTKRDKN
ncbi:MAG TPA: hypothetical protein VI479_10820, partial [Blastocatellia bacterium]